MPAFLDWKIPQSHGCELFTMRNYQRKTRTPELLNS